MTYKSKKRKRKTYDIFEAEKILGIDFLTLHRACKYGFIEATKVDNSDRFGTWRISEAALKRAKKTLPVVLEMKQALGEILLEQQKRKRRA
jgi:hypothetical protein